MAMQFAARVVLLCALALSTMGAAPRELTAVQVLAKMRAANAGLYTAHLVSTSPHTIDGARTIVETDVSGMRYIQRECTGGVCLGTYFDGNRLYSFNINGTEVPMDSQPIAYLRALRVLGMLTFLDPAFEDNGGSIQDGGTADFDGKRCRRIFVRGSEAAELAVFVDPKTGLVAGARTTDQAATISLRDYRRVGGFELPFAIDLNGAPLERYITRAVDSDPFEPPHGLVPAITATPAGMPLDPNSVTPLGSCTIGGLSVSCLLDTGNSALAMSTELAKQLNVRPVGTMNISGLGGFATQVVHAGPLLLGNVKFGDANYAVLPDIHRYGYDLVVGADVLAAMSITIDYSRHAIFFENDEPSPNDLASIPLHFSNFIPTIDVTLGTVPATLAVDTGDQSSINLAYDFYEQHPDLFQVTSTLNVGGIGGTSVEMLGELPQIKIGALAAQNQQIGTTRTLKGTADGHLGAAFLSKYRIVLDYPHEQMRFAPLPTEP